MKEAIWVYDDVRGRGEKYASILREVQIVRRNFETVESIQDEDFKNELLKLRERQNRARQRKEWSEETLLLDQTSVLVIDYDLLRTSEETYLTGENVAYLARCFSECGLILGLNIDLKSAGDNPFDLTLRGHPESYCDLNIGSRQLGNEGLWGGETKGFRPWHWPKLPSYLELFEDKSEEIVSHLDKPISEFLGIEDMIKYSARSITEFIGGDPIKTTFRKFAEKSGNGLRGRDKSPSDEMTARIAVARLSKWLERLVLPGQDLLVDAPHLVSRYPSLLVGDPANVNSWNRTALLDTFDKIGIAHETVEESRFKKVHWLSRPAWFWGKLSKSTRIKEVKEPWEREAIDYVFCEDSSSFHKREDCRKFYIESDSPYNQRFIRYFREERVNYQPRVRLL